MVKLNNFLTFIGISTFWTFVTGYKGECEQFNQYLKNYNYDEINIKKCTTNDDNQMTMLNLAGQNITQEIIDEISTYKYIDSWTLNKIENIPDNLDFRPIHIREVSFYDLGDGRRNRYRGNYLQSTALKSLKNIVSLKVYGYNTSQKNLDDISTLTNLKELEFYHCNFDKDLNYNTLKTLKNLEYLSLTSYDELNSIGEFPEVICQFKKLKTLSLTEGTLTTLPKCIKNLKRLENLDLFSNYIKDLPEEFGKLNNLVELEISANNLKSLPIAFGKLSKLQKLNMDHNEFTKIPNSICHLKKIQNINLSNNALTSNAVPSCIKNLSSRLLILDLGDNKFTVIPNNLTKLSQLQELDLNYNEITAIPTNIKNLINLKTLNLNGNKITTIPESLCSLKNLERLNLSFNEISSIPDSFNQLSNLKYLNINGNKIPENDIPDYIKNIEDVLY